jgi:hypothetical protein
MRTGRLAPPPAPGAAFYRCPGCDVSGMGVPDEAGTVPCWCCGAAIRLTAEPPRRGLLRRAPP